MRATALGLALMLTVGVLGLATDCWWRWECLRWEGHWYTDEACLLECGIGCGAICSGAGYAFCVAVGPAGWYAGLSCSVILGGGCAAACWFACEFGCSYWFETCTEWRWYQVCGGGGDPWPPIYPDSSGLEVPW